MLEHDHPRHPARHRRDGAAVSGTGLIRRYGDGDAAVDALRGVDIDVPPRRVRRRHGPVRLRQVHPDAPARRARRPDRGHRAHRRRGPRRPLRRPAREAAAHARRASSSRASTSSRRSRAEENVVLPLQLRGRARDRGVARRRARPRRARAAAATTGRRSSPAASSSASPSPGRSSPARRCCSPTSRPATSTRAPAPRCSALLRDAVDADGQTIVMVTHDPARRGDRRPRRLPRRRRGRPRAARPVRGRGHRDHGGGDGMRRLAFADLRAHRLRTLLSIIAVDARRGARHRRA